MTFRLTNLFYLFALVAASLTAFGAVGGILVVLGVLVFWMIWFQSRRTVLFLLAIGVVLTLLLIPAMQPARDGYPHYPHNRCLNNTKQLLLAIQIYHDLHGELPPSAGKANDQEVAQSWRVHILRTLEGYAIKNLYDFDEPWDGPNNGPKFASVVMYSHECTEHDHPTEASYFAVTGPQTAWGDGEPRTFDDVTDGLSNTIMLVESAGRGVHWSEPKDLAFDEAVELLTTPVSADDYDCHRIDYGYFFKPRYVRLVALCDGSARALPVPIEREAAVALLTANGGEEIDPEWLKSPAAEPDYGRVWVFSLFVVLALLPCVPQLRPWIWPNLNSDSPTDSDASDE